MDHCRVGCDGDTISLTAASQPSLEDLIMGAIPGIPKVNFVNPSFSCASGDKYIRGFYYAAQGSVKPFIPVPEGPVPDEGNKGEGYWAAFAFLAAKCNRTRCRGFCSTCCRTAGDAPMIPLDECLRPSWPFGATVHEGLGPRRLLRAGGVCRLLRTRTVHRKTRVLGPGGAVQRGQTRLDERSWMNGNWMNGIGGCPSIGGICIGCTMPRFPEKFMPFMNQPPGSLLSSQAITAYGKMIRALRAF